MAEMILISLAKSLALTLLLELAAAWLLGLRSWRDFLLVALVNVLTNPLLGVVLDVLYLYHRELLQWYVVAALELGVVAAEGLLYWNRLECRKRNPFVLSVILNGISYFGGLMLS